MICYDTNGLPCECRQLGRGEGSNPQHNRRTVILGFSNRRILAALE